MASLRSLYHRVRHKVLPIALRRTLKMARRTDLERVGTSYGGWIVPASLVSADSIAYCVGCGEDITFDLGLIERFGCHVWAFDPTPRAIRHVEEHAKGNPKYHFQPFGVWNEDKATRFYLPDNDGFVSGSLVGLNGTKRWIDVEVRRLQTLMRSLGHDHVDLLKIDIEGAEYEVVENLLAERVLPGCLMIEFDQPKPWKKTHALIHALREAGYELSCIDGWNYVFVRPAGPTRIA